MSIDVNNLKHYCYIITNLINNKVYIGITYKDINKRLKEHIKCSRLKNKKALKAINFAILKYGAENFKIELLEECDNKQLVFNAEIKFIKKYNSFKNGYNETLGGDGGPVILSLTKKKIELVLTMFIKNNSLLNIASKTNLSISIIRDILRFRFSDLHSVNNKLIQKVDQINKNSKKRHRITQLIILNIFNDYAYKDYIINDLSKKYGYNISTLYTMLSRKTHNKYIIPQDLIKIVSKKLRTNKRRNAKISDKDIIKIFKMYLQGKNMKEIANTYGTYATKISKILNRKNYKTIKIDSELSIKVYEKLKNNTYSKNARSIKK